MKKILIQFGNWIVKYRKRLVYGVFALFIGQICIFGVKGIGIDNQVFAEDSQPQSQNQEEIATERSDKLSFFVKLVYALLYPLLAIAGKLVDNSFVYGAVFGFDAVLWNLWNIVKNLANYSLGFFVVYKIFEYLIKKGSKTTDIKNMLISALIAGVGIQASRFLMGALIDISTILTYSIGGLPISMLGKGDGDFAEIQLEHNPYTLKTLVYLDVEDLSTFSVYLTNVKTGGEYGDVYISECETVKYDSEEVILAPKKIYYADENGVTHQTENLRCHLYGQVYIFSNLYDGINFASCTDKDDCKHKQIEYKSSLEAVKVQIINGGEGVAGQIGGTLLKIGQTGDNVGLDEYKKDTGEKWETIKLEDILNGKSYVGVFTALYSSLINTVGIMPKDATIFGNVLSSALSLGHLMAIAIPLLVTIVVFMMRIGILWIAIALSPFIVFLTAFHLMEGAKKAVKFLEYLSLENLIPIIFSPAIICFAISLSAVLVNIINNLNVESIETSEEEILGGLVKLDIAGIFIPIGKIIIAILGVAVTWFLVWAAVESTKLGKQGIVTSLKNLAKNAILSVPVVPIPTEDGQVKKVGFGALTANGGIFSNLSEQIERKYSDKGNIAVQELINRKDKESEAFNNRVDAYRTGLIDLSASEISNDWTAQGIMIGEGNNKMPMTFSNIGDNDKKSIVAAINEIEDENKRAVFGKKSSVVIGNDVYEFVGTMKDKKTGEQVTINKYYTAAEKQNLANDKGYI